MKAIVHGKHWFHLDLIAETPTEHRWLLAQMKNGHVHLVCKGYGPMGKHCNFIKADPGKLLLEPSIVNWQRPPERKPRKHGGPSRP